MIPQHLIDEIYSRISIVDLIGQYIEIRQEGTEAMALCPFHKESTPSFSISDEKGLYHCFGCGQSGNHADFLVNHQKMTFPEAISYLAQRAGVDLSSGIPGKGDGDRDRVPVYKYLTKLRVNLESLKVCEDSFLISTYRVDNGKRVHERENFYPRLGSKGSPSEGLSVRNIRHYTTQSDKTRRMIYCGVSLFGPQSTSNEYTGYSYKSKSAANATWCLMASLDFDNVEWKGFKEKPEYKDFTKRDAFLEESKERLYARVRDKLIELGLWDYATIMDSGTGYHVNFILNQLESYKDLDDLAEAGKFEKGEFHEYLMKCLILETRSDPAPASRTFTPVVLPGTTYWKLDKPRKIKVRKDAETYITFSGLYEKLREKSGYAAKGKNAVDKEFFIYQTGFSLFSHIGRLPDQEFVAAVDAYYPKRPNSETIRVDFEAFMESGALPGKDTSDKFFNGREDWPCGDGSQIRITKDYRMQYLKKIPVHDKEGNTAFTDAWPTIPCGWVLLPKYRIENENDRTDFTIVYDCLRPGEKITINIPGSKFGSVDVLQKALRLNQIDITLNTKSAAAFYSYSLKYAKKIKEIEVGINWLRDDEDRFTGSNLVGWDFMLKDGHTYRAKSGFIDTGEEHFYIKGYNYKDANRKEGKYYKSNPEINGKIDKLVGMIDKLFVKHTVSRFYTSFLAAAMLREPLLSDFASVPILSLHGETGCGKSTLLNVARQIFNQKFLTSKPTISTTIKIQKFRKNGVMLFDELDTEHLTNLVPFLKDCVTNAFRERQNKDQEIITDDQIRNTVLISTNTPIHRQGDALDFRMCKLYFCKKMSKYNTEALSDLQHFVSQDGMALYLDLYRRVSAIDLCALEARIMELKKSILTVMKRDARLAEGYAMIVAVGEQIGIGLTYDEVLPQILENESNDTGTNSVLISSIASCAIELSKENPKPAGYEGESKENIDQLYPGGIFLPQEYPITLARMTGYMRKENVFHNIDQRTMNEMLYHLSFIKVRRTSRKVLINNEEVSENGTMLLIDFGDAAFSDMMHQNITLVRKRLEGGKYREKRSVYARVRIDPGHQEDSGPPGGD